MKLTMQGRCSERHRGPILNSYPVTAKHDETGELWKKIWDTLMIYFDSEDVSVKLEKKEFLIELMTEFLGRVPHNMKFYCSSVSAVLTSAARGQHRPFRPLAVAKAFDTLHQFAVRAITQPWRPEYTTLNLYCGHYVHTVLSCLDSSDAELLLAEMGFVADPVRSQVRLVAPDVDQLTRVAIDTLMASTECRMVQRILECLCSNSGGLEFTARQVMAYRVEFVCDVASAVRQLSAISRQTQLCRDLSALQHTDSEPRRSGPSSTTARPSDHSRSTSLDNLIDLDGSDNTPLIPTTLDEFHTPLNSAPTIQHSDSHSESIQQRLAQPVSPSCSALSPDVAVSGGVDTWACHACTFINTSSCNICAICGKTRVHTTLSPPSPSTAGAARALSSSSEAVDDIVDKENGDDDDVACSVCTLLNKRVASRCSACQNPLPTV